MLYTYNEEDYTANTIDILLDELNDFYKKAFDKEQEALKLYNRLVLSESNGKYESIFSDFRGQLYEIIFHYFDFSNFRGDEVKKAINQFRENQIVTMKKYKEDSFDSLFDHFGDNFSVF